MKKVSVITPCYNGEDFIDRYMKMILAQTYACLELVFINDGSTDKTEDIVFSYKEQLQNRGIEFIYCKQKNQGQAVAINKGLTLFSGDYFIYPDSDDVLLPESIKKRVEFLEANPEYGLVGSNGWSADEGNLSDYLPLKRIQHYEVENLFKEIIENELMTLPCVYMFRKEEFFRSVPKGQIYINPDFTLQDVQMLLPIAYYCKCGFLDDYLFVYVIRQNSHSHKKQSHIKKLLNNDAIEDVFLQTINRIEMAINEKRIYLQRIMQWYGRLRNYILIEYLLKKKIIDIGYVLHKRLKNRKFVVFGTGEDAKNFIKGIKKEYYPELFLDNDQNKENKVFCNRPIKQVDFVKKRKEAYLIVIITRIYSTKISQQLLRLGFEYKEDFLSYEDLLNISMEG